MTCSSFGALMLCWGIANKSSGAELPGPMFFAHSLVDRVSAETKLLAAVRPLLQRQSSQKNL
jgi:hypothetical protein